MSLIISHILNDLNESQKRAVVTIEGTLLIVAGPGTGKTLTIVRRIAYLIHKGIKPENIMAVTFTNRAAREMRERTEALLGSDASKVFIGTFHLLGLRIIKDPSVSPPPEAERGGKKGDVFGLNNFVICNREEQIDLLKRIVKDFSLEKIGQKGRRLSYKQLLEKISRIKNFMEDEDDGIKGIYQEYQAALIRNNALDFDDLILKPIEMLGNNGILKKYQDTFRYIMVDEFQDINPAQYKLLKLLANSSGNLCAIGDSDQAIYSFRGADVGNFLSFEEDFKDSQTITLRENYRSTGMILSASNNLIKNNLRRIDKELKPNRENGIPIVFISVPDEKAEGEVIVKEIEERIGGTSHYKLMINVIPPNPPLEKGGLEKVTLAKGGGRDFDPKYSYSFSDFAVIYRTNAQAKTLEESFHTSGIPYQVIGEKYSLQRKETMNVLSFLKAIITPREDIQRIITLLPEEMDRVLLEKFQDFVDKMPLDEFLKVIWEKSAIKQYCCEENFMFLSDLATRYKDMEPEKALDSFINEVSLLTPADTFDPRADAVTLMTLHMAKGLEFRIVFIAGIEDGLIPYTLPRTTESHGCKDVVRGLHKDDVDIEEERRLFYVGMTRAMDELFLIHARSRFLYGKKLSQLPSPFLKEISEEFIEQRFIADRVKKIKKDDQMGLF